MRIRIFRASTLAEAMALVRDELGLDALILSTASQSGLVEVTAALEPEDEPDLLGSQIDIPAHLNAGQVASTSSAVPAPLASLARHNLPPALLSALQSAPLETGCSQLFRFSRLPLDADGPPLLLTGPPGAGKTLTIAKLATRLVMDGHRPLVITADEQRAGAVEQLAAFTRLLGLTLIAAGRPETLARALSRREARSPVLVDAPGLDLLDPVQEDLLAGLVAASGARTAVVLPTGLDPLEAIDIAAAHAARGADLLVATRLSRHARLGGVLAAAHGTNLALTEAGTTVDVVDGLVTLTPALLAAQLSQPLPNQGGPQRQACIAAAPVAPPVQGRGTLALHIAAQAGTPRVPLWKANP